MVQHRDQQLLFPDEPSLYLSPESPGYFGVLSRVDRGPRHAMYPVSHLVPVIEGLNPQIDNYISQADFHQKSRKLIHLRTIGLFFIDLDVYRVEGLRRQTPRELCDVVRLYIADNGLPAPSVILYSGRGLYLKWLIENPVPQAALPRWNAVQKELVNRLSEIGADPQARDASRVLRVDHTTNTKTGEIVRVLHVTGRADEPVRYGFDWFCEMVLPQARDTIKKERKARTSKKQGSSKSANGFTYRSLAWARLLDLRTLYSLRGGVPEGERMLNLFYRLNFLLLSGIATSKTMWIEAQAIAKEVDPNWSYRRGELSTLFRKTRANEKGEKIVFNGRSYPPLYTPRNDTLITTFQIESDEMKWLSTIIDGAEKKRRKRLAQEKQRREDGRVPRDIYEEQSTARQAPWDDMRISRRTYYRRKKAGLL